MPQTETLNPTTSAAAPEVNPDDVAWAARLHMMASAEPRFVHYPEHGALVQFPGYLSEEDFQGAAHNVWDQFKQFGSGLSQALGGSGDLKSDIAGTVRGIEHPLDTLKTIAGGIASVPSQQTQSLEKAKESYNARDHVGAAAHAINYLLPFVGPANEQASELLKQGKTSQALGMMTGTAATLLPGGEEEVVRPVTRTVEAVPKTITELKPALQEAITGESGEATIPFTGKGTTESTNVPVFYSKLERVAAEKLPKSATGDQILATLRNSGVKENEIQWMGLDDYLKGKAKVSKEDLLQHINENKIELREVDLGTPEQRQMQTLSKQRQELYAENNRIWMDHLKYDPTDLSTELFNAIKQGSDLGINETINRMPDVMQGPARRFVETDRQLVDLDNQIAKLQYQIDRSGAKAPKYESYTLPGPKDNYTEKLLALPTKNADRIAELKAKMQAMSERPAAEHAAHPEWQQQWDEWAQEMRNLTGARARMAQENFTSSHFDEPNILAHTRYDDRIDTEGKRNLFLEEVQSDWAQTMKKEGTKQSFTPEERREYDRLNTMGGAVRNAREQDRFAELEEKRLKGTPAMPFAADWHELAMKRMLREAAEKGYDRLAWTTGEQQAARYNLANHVNDIEVTPRTNATTQKPAGRAVTINFKGERVPSYLELGVADNGIIDNATQGDFVGKSLADVVGKDMAAKILQRDRQDISGEGLSIGGDWANALYDRAIPNFLNKYAKRWGAKVGQTELSVTNPGTLRYEIVDPQGNVQDAFRNQGGAEEAVRGYNEAHHGRPGKWTVRDTGKTEKVWHIDITPAMKKSLLKEGQPIAKAEPWQDIATRALSGQTA